MIQKPRTKTYRMHGAALLKTSASFALTRTGSLLRSTSLAVEGEVAVFGGSNCFRFEGEDGEVDIEGASDRFFDADVLSKTTHWSDVEDWNT